MFVQNSNTERCKSGNPALLSAHFADAISPEKSNNWSETREWSAIWQSNERCDTGEWALRTRATKQVMSQKSC
jgi:hypothetical protein